MQPVKLLLVDDHEAFLNSARRVLRKEDWLEIVGMATNGLDAIRMCEDLTPDAVLMDMAMPEMGGLQAMRVIKAGDNPPVVIIASHFDDQDHREQALRSGADAFVSKLSYSTDAPKFLKTHFAAQIGALLVPAE